MFSNQLTIMEQHETPPCVSIVIALPAGDRKAALQCADNTIHEAVKYLQAAFPEKVAGLKQAFQSLRDEFQSSYDPGDAGIGLYVSSGYSRLIRYSFPVQTKVWIGATFAVRELLYQEQYAADYLVLHIEEKQVQLFRGHLNRLVLVKDDFFPMEDKDQYEYANSFEKDKSLISAGRQKVFYREADRRLTKFLHGQPFILTGPTKDIGFYEEITHHKEAITATIYGNYSSLPLKELEARSWPAIRIFIDNRGQEVMRELIEKTGRQQVVDGIRDVLDAAREGKGDKLVIELDFESKDCTDKLTGLLKTKSPEAVHEMDAVEDAMRTVIDKNGEIIFVKPGVLEDHKHIALITRY